MPQNLYNISMKKYSIYLWGIVTLFFVSFIGIMSYWYPVTLDEYFRWGVPLQWTMIVDSYFYITPRISSVYCLPIFSIGKWSFILLNCLIQFLNCLCIFYILFVRLPDIKQLKDMPYFLIILFMSIFFICRPSEVMFWVSGAINYTWSISFFLLMLCFLRQVQTNKVIFKDNWCFKSCLFILGFIVGMSNECLAPIALGLAICSALFFEYKKIKTPRVLSFLIFGLAVGCLVFFSAPAHYNKMSLDFLSNVSSVPLSQKLFFHISHFNEFLQSQFYLFIITFLFLLIAFLDKDKKNIKRTDLWISVFALIISFAMTFVLFVVPQPPLRAYYPASISCLISFLFLVKHYIEVYKFDFSKWLCYIILAICLFLFPSFVLPHYSLHLQDKAHAYLESHSKKIKSPFMVLKGPTYNLSIGLMDPARRIEIGNGMYTTDSSPLINW